MKTITVAALVIATLALVWKAPGFSSFLQVVFTNYGGALLILLGIVWVIRLFDGWIKRACEGG